MTVTPVRTLSPSISVVMPTSTPGTSVIAFTGPGVPRSGMPKLPARGCCDGVCVSGAVDFGIASVAML
jgi:hypothetical protein